MVKILYVSICIYTAIVVGIMLFIPHNEFWGDWEDALFESDGKMKKPDKITYLFDEILWYSLVNEGFKFCLFLWALHE